MQPDPVADPTFEIVGVLRDTRNASVRDAASPEVVVPSTTRQGQTRVIVARAAGDPALTLEAIRREVRALDRGLAVLEGRTMEKALSEQFHTQPRFSLIVLSTFALTGLVLVALGIYGVLAYVVSRQTREIAVRIALGAERGQILRFVLTLGMRLVAGGIVAGLAASVAANRLLAHQLWNTTPGDPLTFGAAIAVILGVGTVACLVPAMRAVRVDPMAALRSE
jgi:putative ABC transport system permease protein